MPVLKANPVVTFDPHNPEHVRAVLEVDVLGKRNTKINFDYPAEFQSGMNYARHQMARAWGEMMAQKHPDIKNMIEGASSGPIDMDNIRPLPVIGLRSKPLQDVAHRTLA